MIIHQPTPNIHTSSLLAFSTLFHFFDYNKYNISNRKHRFIYINHVQSIKSKMFLKSICRFKDVSMNPRDVVMAVLCHLEMKQEHQ